MSKVRSYPDTRLRDNLRALGCNVKLFWEVPGPKDTQVGWLSLYYVMPENPTVTPPDGATHGVVHGGFVLVQTWKDGGYEFYMAGRESQHAESALEVVKHFGIVVTGHAVENLHAAVKLAALDKVAKHIGPA